MSGRDLIRFVYASQLHLRNDYLDWEANEIRNLTRGRTPDYLLEQQSAIGDRSVRLVLEWSPRAVRGIGAGKWDAGMLA